MPKLFNVWKCDFGSVVGASVFLGQLSSEELERLQQQTLEFDQQLIVRPVDNSLESSYLEIEATFMVINCEGFFKPNSDYDGCRVDRNDDGSYQDFTADNMCDEFALLVARMTDGLTYAIKPDKQAPGRLCVEPWAGRTIGELQSSLADSTREIASLGT